ncbi:MAG: class I SAM-dependent methyltransferase [Crocinitomicaceae bacterium]|nr:class I SAM-dependent methyltransferase [Crocinitomicaceae bacterium]
METTSSTVAVFDKYAKDYAEKFMDVSRYIESMDEFCKHLPQNSGLLELGCGPGNITRYVNTKRPDLAIHATDLSVNMLELAKTNCPSASVQMMDFRDLHKIKDKFQGIIAGFCVPYLNFEDTLKLIHDASKLLQPGGLLYLSAIQGEYANSKKQVNSHGDEVMIYFHEEKYLREFFTRENLDVIHSLKTNNPLASQNIKDELILIGKRN